MGGSHAQLRAVTASRTWPVPEGLDMRPPALPIWFGTAGHALFARGGLSRGETVLVQAAPAASSPTVPTPHRQPPQKSASSTIL